ncbi:MAG: hypothetical protein MK193_07765 [Lentisphaeria bacterium]|nr:hypothetical protein [Lentisphaeria bacterium]
MPLYTYAFFFFVAWSALQAYNKPHKALYYIIIIVALQDVVRKGTPGAPSWLVLACSPVIGMMVIKVIQDNNLFQFYKKQQPIAYGGLIIFLYGLIIPIFIDLSYGFRGVLIILVSFVVYGFIILCPIVSCKLNLEYKEEFYKILAFYTIVVSIMIIGAPLEYYEVYPNNQFIGTAALDMEWIRYIPGKIVKLYAGFYRSPDVLGIHSILSCMVAVLLFFKYQSFFAKFFFLSISIWSTYGTFLCGRRKFFYLIPVFFILLVYLNKILFKKYFFTIITTLGVFAIGLYIVNNQSDDTAVYYVTTTDESFERIEKHGLSAVFETFKPSQGGFWGKGLGVSQQGARFVTGGLKIGAWQEGGLSRLAVELGVIGFMCALYFIYATFRSMWNTHRTVLRSKKVEDSIWSGGLLALIGAMALSLTVSGQIISDPFTAFFIAFIIGAQLSFKSNNKEATK